MRVNISTISMIGALFFCNIAYANNACLLEAKRSVMGIPLDIKDCIQNAGLAATDFKAQCEGVSQASVAMGGPAAKITYLASCPVPFQAKCDNTKIGDNRTDRKRTLSVFDLGLGKFISSPNV